MSRALVALPTAGRARAPAPRARPPLPPLAYPMAAELAYASDLLTFARTGTEYVRRRVVPALPAILHAHGKRLPRVDDTSERLQDLMGSLTGVFGMVKREARVLATKMIDIVSGKHATDFGDAYSVALKVNPLLGQEKWLAEAMRLQTEQNVALISSIPLQLRTEAERVITDGVMAGRTAEQVAAELVSRCGVVESRATLIARDQVSKWHGDLQRFRQIDAGCVAYIWSTSRDERVRRSHKMMEDKRCRWDDPPAVGSRGQRVHPGQDVMCRCCAIPLVDEEDEPPADEEVKQGLFGRLFR